LLSGRSRVRRIATHTLSGYRTLQRPEDIIEWSPKNIVRKREPDGNIRRVIRSD